MRTKTTAAGPNATISPLGAATVTGGGSKTYTIKPKAGYHVADVKVDGESLMLPQLINNQSYTYTFTKVKTPHTISATFAQN